MYDVQTTRWPKTVDDAVDLIIVHTSEEEKDEIRGMSQEGLLTLHYELGMCIRNSFGLWEGNKELLESCGSAKMHQDRTSVILIFH